MKCYRQCCVEGLLSLTPLIYLDTIQKHSTLDQNQFTFKKVDLGIPTNEAHNIEELTD